MRKAIDVKFNLNISDGIYISVVSVLIILKKSNSNAVTAYTISEKSKHVLEPKLESQKVIPNHIWQHRK